MELPKRKVIRLKEYDYSSDGTYFITICVNNRKPILSKINVGTGVLDRPKMQLSYYGEIADKYINQMKQFYNDISVDKYIIMPNHIHMLISICNGQSRTPVPTNKGIKIDNTNSIIAKFVSTFKRFCNKEYDANIWQRSFYDHIIRDENDYIKACEYIDNNPAKWNGDELFVK
ncbi:MAG: transposase [Acutalibacteraceae bacterium]|nr:transposase [Acutalibacteraceae bacterium]